MDIRDKILDATERLLARYGYARMTVEDIAREAGIGKGTIYLHFPSKEEVVLSRLDRMVERLVDELRGIAASRKSPAEKVRAMLVTRVLFRFDSARGYAESMDEMLADIRAGLLARREKHFAAEAAVLAGILKTGFVCRNVDDVAQALILATNSLLPYSLTARQLGRRAAVERKAHAIAALLIDGLRRKP